MLTFSHLRLLCLSGSLVAASTGCTHHSENQDPTPDVQAVYYEQTQCADKWGQASTTTQLVSMASAYLTQQGISFTQASAASTGTVTACSSCICPTGLVLRGNVARTNLPRVLALGFRQ